MRTLTIGDIHGCQIALATVLDEIALRPNDQIVFLGDYIDRGTGSRAVIDQLLNLRSKSSLVFLRGNHEAMILEARCDTLKANLWQSYGGFETLISYGAEYSQNWQKAIPDSHWEFFEHSTRFYESETHIFVHACLDPDAEMAEQPDWLLFWESLDRLKPHKSGKRIICGHTPQKSGEILNLEFALCIDTGAINGGWLTCLDVDTGNWIQANEKRRVRRGSISP